MLESQFRAIISGEQQGFTAGLARSVLGLLELPYTAVVNAKNHRYDADSSRVHSVDVPVISVGNLTLGGTGKTPMVKWIARRIQERGARVALVSRGYGSTGDKNDEALELEQALPGVPHVQNPDRVMAARQALADHGAEVLLLDDGFQHRRLARDLDIVLLDATAPFGYDRVFPRGMLREPATGLARADVVCLSRANLVDDARRETIRQQASRLAPNADWCEVSHAPSALLTSDGQHLPLADLAGKRVAAFCGIGNPDAFRATLEKTGCEVVDWSAFPDHHQYSTDEIVRIVGNADAQVADWIVCTHKDLVKVDSEEVSDQRLAAVVVEMEFSFGEEDLLRRIVSVWQ